MSKGQANRGRAGWVSHGGGAPTVDKLFISLDYIIVIQYKGDVGEK